MTGALGRSSLIALCAFALALLGGCGEERERSAPRVESPHEARAAAPLDSVEARDEWSPDEVIRRLTEAGLVVTDSGRPVRNERLKVEGSLLRVSGAELEIYLYPDAATRRSAAAALDTAQRGLPTLDRPRYIESGNLIAILRTPSERTAERVENVLLARHGG